MIQLYTYIQHNGKESASQCRSCRRHGFDPWVRKIPWSRKCQPFPVFLPGKFHGQRSLAGYSPCGHKELDTTERLNNKEAVQIFWPMAHSSLLKPANRIFKSLSWSWHSCLLLLFHKELCACVLSCFCHIQLFVTTWTVACQATLSVAFTRQ